VPAITLPEPYELAPDAAASPPPAEHQPIQAGVEPVSPAAAAPVSELHFDTELFDDWLSHAGTGRRVLVLGWSPLPFENTKMNFAPGVRSWQFAQPLANQGDVVCLACARIPGTYPEGAPRLESFVRDDVLVFTMERADFEHGPFLPALMTRFQPEALVGAAPVPSQRAVALAGELPLWLDTFGDPMSEAQAKMQASNLEGNHPLAYARLLSSLLVRGDRFSAVSERQRLALLGQLGLVGRLTAETVGYQLACNIPCCGSYNRIVDGAAPAEASELFAEDDFVVFWSGGFNTWCDIDVLVEGIDLAMRQNPGIHFLSTGGAIEGHDSMSYARFEQLVAASRYPERFVLKGTLPKSEADAWSQRADLGIVTEKRMAERELGSSGRVLNWLTQGIPVLCTSLSELGETLEREGGALTYEVANAESLAARLVEASRDTALLERIRQRGRELADDLWSAEATTRELREWLRHPRRAPDAAMENPIFDVDLLAANQQLEEQKERLEVELRSVTRNQAEIRQRLQQLDTERVHLETEREHFRASAEDWQRQWRELGAELGQRRSWLQRWLKRR
jgi:glycosyltransferase involved in cell wall biosynthesis